MIEMQITACLTLGMLSLAALAQTSNTFKARLSPVPLDLSMQDKVAGMGHATATLNGSKVTIVGTFEGLKSAATVAQIRRSPVTGVRGPVVFDLTVAGATSGNVGGTFDLTADQVAMLRSGKLYIQIRSEKAPDGNLWGWLLP